MKKFFILVPYLMMIFHSELSVSQNTQLHWVKHMGGIGMDWVADMEIDANQNVYTVGWFRDTADFDPGPGVYYLNGDTAANNTMFISKLDSSGNFVWAKEFVLGQPSGNDIAIDNVGNLWVFGDFFNTSDFDPGPGLHTMTPVGYRDVFILKIDASGNFLWAGQMGGQQYDFGEFLDLDEDGNIYLLGTFVFTADFDPGVSIFNLNTQSAAFFVTKLDSNGNFINAFKLDATGFLGCRGIAADTSNGLVLAGTFSDTVDFDPGPQVYQLDVGTNSNSFVCRLDTAGNFYWVRTMYDNQSHMIESVSFDAAGNVYSTGSFYDTAYFDPLFSNLTMVSTGLSDCFFMQWNNSGNLNWVKRIGGTSYDRGMALIDKNNHFYLLGHFDDVVDFDPGSGIFNMIAQYPSSFVAEFDYNGNFISVNQMGPFVCGLNTNFQPCESGTIYMSGNFEGTCDFNNSGSVQTLTSFGYQDVFVSRWNDCSSFIPLITAMGPTSFCQGDSVILSAPQGLLSYQWYNRLYAIPGATTANLTVKSQGRYRCLAQNAVMCSDTSNMIIVTVPCLPPIDPEERIENSFSSEKINFTIFPNPTSGKFIIESPEAELRIYNSLGEIVFNLQTKPGISNVDLTDFPEGVYFVKLVTGDQIYKSKISLVR